MQLNTPPIWQSVLRIIIGLIEWAILGVILAFCIYQIVILTAIGVKADSAEVKPALKANICATYCQEKTIKVCAVDYPEACTNLTATFCNQSINGTCQLKFSSFN
jgi:hypothetical protein